MVMFANEKPKYHNSEKLASKNQRVGQPLSAVFGVLNHPGYEIDPLTRREMGSRFGFDFSQIRIHHGEEAGRAAAAMQAWAFTLGNQIVFGKGMYAPHLPLGQYILAHELAHTIQQQNAIAASDLTVASPNSSAERQAHRAARQVQSGYVSSQLSSISHFQIQRVGIWESIARFFGEGSYSDDELTRYLRTLREGGSPERNIDSDDKARAVTQRWITGNSPLVLTPTLIALMITEMQIGFTGDEDEQAILELLERCRNHELRQVFQTVNPRSLNSDFHGEEWDRLQDFYRRRFQGGMQAVLNGQIVPIGDPAPLGTALSAHQVQRAQDPNPGDRVIAAQCGIRAPENCHSFEDWIRQFPQLPTFQARSGHRVIGPERVGNQGGPAPQATATDPTADPSVRRPTLELGRQRYWRTDRFIDGPTDEWVNANLPRNLVRVAYQVPSDCADIAVILRHVWLVAHHRATEVYRGWLIGSDLGNPRVREIQNLVRGPVVSQNVSRIVRPYSGPSGVPIRSFTELERLLHPGDVLVWEHQDLRGRRTGGHTQTISRIQRSGDTITQIDLLQGNQPITRGRAEAIHTQNPSGPSVGELSSAPGRRIEVSQISGQRLGNLGNVWGWYRNNSSGTRIGQDILLAVGPPAIRHQPASRRGRSGSDVVRGLEDWSNEMAQAQSLSQLQSFFEAALLEASSLLEGQQSNSLTETEARAFGRATGIALWRLANQSARERSEFTAQSGSNPSRIRDAHLRSEDLGAEAHYRPLRHMLGMLESLANRARVELVRQRFRLIQQELEPAARGQTSISFQRPNLPAGTQVANVLVTGFDPFRFEPQAPHRQIEPLAGDWNPSGAAVLQLDGKLLPVASNLQAAVEGVIFPVRYDQFRAGLVESVVRPLLPNVHGIVTISMDPSIPPSGVPQIERYAVGVHRLNNGVMESIPPASVPGQPRRTDPGPAILEAQGDIPGIAQEANLSQTSGDTNVQLEFNDIPEANRFRSALNLRSGATRQVNIDFLAHANRISQIELGVQSSAITLRVGNQSFQASILRGPGGRFLSNEVSYRVLRMIQESAQRGQVTSFHVHTPRGTAQERRRIPQAAETTAERQTRFQALQLARGVLTRLVDTIKRMIAAIARRAFHQNSQSP